MMRTTIKPSDNNGKRLFCIRSEDQSMEEGKFLWARDVFAAFGLYYCGMDKEEYASLQDLEIDISGSVSNQMTIWVGEEMYSVEDITKHKEDFI